MKRGGYHRPRTKDALLTYYIEGLSCLNEWSHDMEKSSYEWTMRYLDQRAQSLDRVLHQLGLAE